MGQKDELCGTGDRTGSSGRERAASMEKLLLGGTKERDHERLRRALMRLFPRLESVRGNLHYSEHSAVEWARERRVCAEDHFDAYFRFSIGDGVLPREEIQRVIANASDPAFVQDRIRKALATLGKDGKTKAALLLEALQLHAADVADHDVGPLLSAIFALADELDVATDEAGGFSIGDNQLRIHWLLRALTLERFDLATRSALFIDACAGASLAWLADFAGSAFRDYQPSNNKPPEPEERCLTTEADADALQALTLQRIQSAAQSGELLKARRLARLLFVWRNVAMDDGAEVKAWTTEQFKSDAAIVTFARAFTTHSWSQGMGMAGLGDVVAKRHTRAGVSSLELVLELPAFRARVEALDARNGADDDAVALREFLEAWRRHDANPND